MKKTYRCVSFISGREIYKELVREAFSFSFFVYCDSVQFNSISTHHRLHFENQACKYSESLGRFGVICLHDLRDLNSKLMIFILKKQP